MTFETYLRDWRIIGSHLFNLANPLTTDRSAKKFKDTINNLASIFVACGLMVWGIFNISTNIQDYWKSEDETMAWGIALAFVIVTSVVPFLIGLWMLFRATAPPGKPRKR